MLLLLLSIFTILFCVSYYFVRNFEKNTILIKETVENILWKEQLFSSYFKHQTPSAICRKHVIAFLLILHFKENYFSCLMNKKEARFVRYRRKKIFCNIILFLRCCDNAAVRKAFESNQCLSISIFIARNLKALKNQWDIKRYFYRDLIYEDVVF